MNAFVPDGVPVLIPRVHYNCFSDSILITLVIILQLPNNISVACTNK